MTQLNKTRPHYCNNLFSALKATNLASTWARTIVGGQKATNLASGTCLNTNTHRKGRTYLDHVWTILGPLLDHFWTRR